jgi:Skp family chaperone for outer membrane proteins
MQIFVRGILTLVAALAAIPAMAGNIGFLDTERAIKTVKEGQRQLQILDEWSTQKSDQVEQLRSRVTELTQQLNAQRTVASADAIRQLEDQLLVAQRSFEDAGRSLQRDFEAKQRELLALVATRVRDLVGEYALSNGFDAVFMLESQPLVYIANSAVITDAVIQLYDERYPIN